MVGYWQWYRRGVIDQIQLHGLLLPIRAALDDRLHQAPPDNRGADVLRTDLLRH
jgi:hypothetical protein